MADEPVTPVEIAAAIRGAPLWITAESVLDTLATWQPYYAEKLTAEDAVDMLIRVGQLFEIVYLDQRDAGGGHGSK
jgi:hypothetical protein